MVLADGRGMAGGRPASDRAVSVLALLLTALGLALLLVPHRVEARLQDAWLTSSVAYGVTLLAVGGLLLWVRFLPVASVPLTAGSLAMGALLLAAGAVSLRELDGGHWSVVLTALAGMGAAAAYLAVRPEGIQGGRGRTRASSDLASLVAYAAAAGTGALMAFRSDGFGAVAYDVLGSARPAVGWALLALGAVLLVGSVFGIGGRAWPAVWSVGNALLAAIWFASGAALGAEGQWGAALLTGTLALAVADAGVLGTATGRVFRGGMAMTSARRRIVLTSATSSLAAALVLTLLLAASQERNLRQTIDEEHTNSAEAVASQVELFLTNQLTALGVAVDTQRAQFLTGATAAPALKAFSANFPTFSVMSIVGVNGLETARSDGGTFVDRSTDPTVARALAGERLVAGPLAPAADGGEPTMTLATPLTDVRTGRQVGAVVAVLPLAALDAFIQTQATPNNRLVVVGADGLLISHPDKGVLAERDAFVRSDAARRALATGGSGAVEEETPSSEGAGRTEPSLVGYAALAQPFGWAVMVQEELDEAFAGVETARDRVLLYLSVAAVLVVLFSLVLAYIVLKPAADLVAPVSAMGAGDWDARLPAADDSELGQLIRAFGRMRDQIHEREAQLIQRNDELVASRLKSQFLTAMTNELRTPMDGILGYGHLLLDGVDGELTPEQAADVAQMTQSAEQLLGLINNVLDFSALDAGEMVLAPEPTDLVPLLEHVRNQFALEAGNKGIELAVDLPPTLPMAEVDGTSVQKIAVNLVANAVKFTERGRITVTVRSTPTTVELSVTDTGIGIAPEALDHIFEEFRQADADTARRYGGAGLGLSIARKLAELQGGSIRVASRLGIGTTFTVRLPRVAEAGPLGEEADGALPSPLSEIGRRLTRLGSSQRTAPPPTGQTLQPVGAGAGAGDGTDARVGSNGHRSDD